MEKPYTVTYRPKNTTEIQGHEQAINRVKKFVNEYSNEKKKGLLLYGAPGSGKTSLAHALANELGLEIVEVNASDRRNPDSINQLLGGAIKQMSLFGAGKLILLDEVDGLSGTKDRGGIPAMIDIMKESSFPVLLTANNPWDKKFSTLRKHVEMVELKTLPYTSVFIVLKNVCEEEGIMYEEAALKQLARRAGGDLRGALTDLQTISGDGMVDQDDLEALGERRKVESMFNALTRILKGRNPKIAREGLDTVDEDIDEFFSWVDENIPREYTKGEDVEAAMDALSKADVMRGRIRRWQHWRFLVYVIDWMTAGVSLAKKEKYSGFTKFSRTQRQLKYWRAAQANKKRDAIALKIGEKTHTSVRVARESLPYIANIVRKDKKHAAIDYFDFAEEEVDWLVKKA